MAKYKVYKIRWLGREIIGDTAEDVVKDYYEWYITQYPEVRIQNIENRIRREWDDWVRYFEREADRVVEIEVEDQ